MKPLYKPPPGPRRSALTAALLLPFLALFANCSVETSSDDARQQGGGAGGSSSGKGSGGSGGNENGGGGSGGGTNGGGGSGTNGGGGSGGTSTPGPPPGGPGGPWELGQSLTKNWDSGSPGWQDGNSVTFDSVEPNSTLVLCAYGYTYPNVPFGTPVDSEGQEVVVAVDTGTDRYVQATAWVIHNTTAGTHTLTNLPDFSTGDGKLFFAEFRNGGKPSTTILGAGTTQLDAYEPPWLTTGSVTMSAGANEGDLLVAFSFEEEAGIGNTNTIYTDPPEGWGSLGVQNQSKLNIAGEACWRNAFDNKPQTVSWEWNITGGQDPSLFKAAIFAIHAP